MPAPALLVDTHCHLELIAEEGGGEPATTLEEAVAAGVGRVINIGLGPDNLSVLERARSTANVFATVGWHPHQAEPPSDDELTRMRELALDPRVVAIGEIGLDYFWRPGYHEVPAGTQKVGFRRMLDLARLCGLPAVVHNREAHADTLEVLDDYSDVRVVMHAFSGDVAFASECVRRGVVLSVAGPITYPSAGTLREAVATVAPENLVVETDAPFLPPQPWRGKPNRPHMMVVTATRVAELIGVSLVEFTSMSTRTAERVYRFPAPLQSS
ncbi:MAG: TatD family hydrolase [Candidatus Dormibacteria bacterium]